MRCANDKYRNQKLPWHLHLVRVGVALQCGEMTPGPLEAFRILKRARYRNGGQS